MRAALRQSLDRGSRTPLSWFWIACFALDSIVGVFPTFDDLDHF